jgi:hypothetical protein
MKVDQLTEETSGSEAVMGSIAPRETISFVFGMTPESIKRVISEKGTPSSPMTHALFDLRLNNVRGISTGIPGP